MKLIIGIILIAASLVLMGLLAYFHFKDEVPNEANTYD